MNKKSHTPSQSCILLATTAGTAFASTAYLLNHEIAVATLFGWLVFFHLGTVSSFFVDKDSAAWPWLAARVLGYGALLAFSWLTLHYDCSMSVRFSGLLAWKWFDLLLSYRVVNADQ